MCSVELLLRSSPDAESFRAFSDPSPGESPEGRLWSESGLLLWFLGARGGGESARWRGRVELPWRWLLLLWRRTSSATPLQCRGLPGFWLPSLAREGGVVWPDDGEGVEDGEGRPKLDISRGLLRFSSEARRISRTVGFTRTVPPGTRGF